MKHVSTHSRSLITLLAAVSGLVASIQCGGSTTSPTSPTSALSSVTLSGASVPAGATGQGTVTLSAAAPSSGASVALVSSNTAVATVPATLTVPAGSSSATFTIAAVAAGTAAITASIGGSSMQSPALTVTAKAALVSISLANGSVVGGDAVIGTATLSGAAPAGGAMVTLSASDPVTLPATVMVLAGSTSATFSAFTRAVGGTVSATITGSYGGDSKSAVLSVTPPTAATASFGVTGATETETCALGNGGNTINCTFNGSTSTAPGTIVAWDWTYGVKTTFSQTTSGPVLSNPAVNCSLIPAPPLPSAPADQWFAMTVTLKVHDSLGNVSAVATNKVVRLFPQGACGF
jgi:hypothetical protein